LEHVELAARLHRLRGARVPRSADRRRRGQRLRFPERRTGFDRRTCHLESGLLRARERALHMYRDQAVCILVVLIAANVANILDLMLTQRALALGASEANPIMALLLVRDPFVAMAFKIGAGLLVTGAIWCMRRYRAVLVTSVGIAAGFAALIGYHAVGACLWL
jgi:hypothetical protein